MSTKRTILSPFTKEYRVLAALSGIHLFLEGFSDKRSPNKTNVKLFMLFSYTVYFILQTLYVIFLYS